MHDYKAKRDNAIYLAYEPNAAVNFNHFGAAQVFDRFSGSSWLAAATYETNYMKLNTYENKDEMGSEAEAAYADLQEDLGDETNRAWLESAFAGVFANDKSGTVGDELQGSKNKAESAVTTGKCHIQSLYITVPGFVTLIHVFASIKYMWAISSHASENIYFCARPCRGSWKKSPGTLNQLVVDDQEVWECRRAVRFIYIYINVQ